MASKKNKKKSDNAAPSSSGNVPLDNRTSKELKVKGKLAKRSSNSSQVKDDETATLSQSRDREKAAKYGDKYVQKDDKSGNMNSGNRGNNNDFQSRGMEKKAKDGRLGNNYADKDDRKFENEHIGNKEKGSTSKMSASVEKKDQKTEKSVGGVIFMCNAKTKADCFRYHVMGVSASHKDIIMGIKPGLKLFLFDVDLKLLYGIYKASSAGGMKLEPAAFGGAFPAQIRFKIDKDCIPLPEEVFKKAIKDSYNERTHKFNTELTFKQVEDLRKMFKPAPPKHSTPKHSMSEPVTQPPSVAPFLVEEPIREHVNGRQYSRTKAGENYSSYGHEKQQPAGHHILPREVDKQPRFLTEREYRTFGLQSANHQQPIAPALVDRTLDYFESEQGRELLRRNPTSFSGDAALARKETVHSEPLFPSEREYRTYGLKGRGEIPAVENSSTPISSTRTNSGLNHVKDTYNPYDESTASLVNRYLSLPRTVVTPPVESFSSTGRESFASDRYSAIDIRESFASDRSSAIDIRESFASDRYSEIDIRGHTGRFHTENERAYPPYGYQLPPDYGLRYHDPRDEPRYDSTSAPSRYSFAGPYAPRH